MVLTNFNKINHENITKNHNKREKNIIKNAFQYRGKNVRQVFFKENKYVCIFKK
jgi:hypothetical protein